MYPVENKVSVARAVTCNSPITCRMSDYSYSDDDGVSDEDSFSDDDNVCFKCGKAGHWANECYVKKRSASSSGHTHSKERKVSHNETAGVYTIQDSTGKVYVGKSNNIEKRIEEHKQGLGTAFLSKNGITQIQTVTSGSKNDMESWERAETLTQMYHRGITRVRGWMFTTSSLSEHQVQDAFGQICEKFDLCRKCGRNSHFISSCFAKSKADWAIRHT